MNETNCLLYDGNTVCMFLKYLEDHDTYKEDTVQFGEDVAAVLNKFQYKYKIIRTKTQIIYRCMGKDI